MRRALGSPNIADTEGVGTRLGGVLCMSGYLPRPHAFKCDENPPQVLICHGSADPMVKFQYAEATRDQLSAANVDVSFETYWGMEHCACREEIDDVGGWLEARLSVSTASGD